MEKYVKPVMEVEEIENDSILTLSINNCDTGIGLGYGGSCSSFNSWDDAW